VKKKKNKLRTWFCSVKGKRPLGQNGSMMTRRPQGGSEDEKHKGQLVKPAVKAESSPHLTTDTTLDSRCVSSEENMGDCLSEPKEGKIQGTKTQEAEIVKKKIN
jgi:hypothetical protein